MKKLEIKLNSFSEQEIKKASATMTTADVRFWKNKNSLFYKDPSTKLFTNIKNGLYGIKIALISQFVFNIAFSVAGKDNKAFSIKYSTINEHLTNEFSASENYISEVINKFVDWNLIKRWRVSRYLWNMQLTDYGYKMLFGVEIGSNAYLLTKTKNSYFIYELIKSKLRAFRSFCGSIKKKSKLEFIKKVMLGMKFYYDETKQIAIDDPPPNDIGFVETNRGQFLMDEILTDEDIAEMFNNDGKQNTK